MYRERGIEKQEFKKNFFVERVILLINKFNKKKGVSTNNYKNLTIRYVTLIAIIFIIIGPGYCKAQDNDFSSTNKQAVNFGQYTFSGFFSLSEITIECHDYQGSALISNPALAVGYDGNWWNMELQLGLADFETEHTSVSSALSLGLEFGSVLYELSNYYSWIEGRITGRYIEGDGHVGPDDTFVQVEIVDLSCGLFLIASYDFLELYGGLIGTELQGRLKPQGFEDSTIDNRGFMGFGGGIDYYPGWFERGQLSAEIIYRDSYQLTVEITYRI